MNPELINLLIATGLQAYQTLRLLKATDPAAFEAALQQVGDDHKAALARLEAAVGP
jgi:hypothetical protein